MKRLIIACAVFCLLGSPTWAGVVMEMEVRNADAAGKTGAETFYAEGEMTRTDFLSANGKDSSLIFRDQTMYFVDHAEKVCQKIDKAGVDQLSSQMNAMMKQMASMPPEQRQMMEKMMKGRMPGMGKPPVRRVEEGGMDQVESTRAVSSPCSPTIRRCRSSAWPMPGWKPTSMKRWKRSTHFPDSPRA